jgi:Flp pilus assembly protein TadG
MMRIRSFRSDQRGVSAVEFGLLAPVLISFVVGTAQLGTLFFANADMRNAIAAGARAASVWPVPQPDAVKAAVEAQLVRRGAGDAANVTVTDPATDANGNPYMQIAVTYDVPLDFLLYSPTVTLGDTRTVLVQRASGAAAEDEDEAEEEPTEPTEPTDPTDPTDPVDPPVTPPTNPPGPPSTPPGHDKDKHEDHGTCKKKCG